jgi:hypothetical protein
MTSLLHSRGIRVLDGPQSGQPLRGRVLANPQAPAGAHCASAEHIDQQRVLKGGSLRARPVDSFTPTAWAVALFSVVASLALVLVGRASKDSSPRLMA